MEKDITLDVGDDYVLNCRATGVIIHNNKILFHHNPNSIYYALMGGRIHIGEDSKNAVLREFKEELGKDVEIVKGITTIENFFNFRGKKYHEMSFLYQLEFKDENDKNIEETLYCIEKNDKNIRYEWLSIDKLEEYDIRPRVIIDILKNSKYDPHVINIENNY